MPSESRRTSRGPSSPGRSGPGRGGRPPSGPPPAAAGAADDGRRRPRLTGRAAILVLVVSVLAVSYASSMRAYLQQRGQIDDLKGQIALREANISDLEREKGRWEDPAYVKQQARELNFVMPGETAYVVLDKDGKPLQHTSELTDPSTVAQKAPTAWWHTAWQSLETAGNPPKVQSTTPVTRINEGN